MSCYFLCVAKESNQRKGPCFAFLPEKFKICFTEISELATLKHAEISYKF